LNETDPEENPILDLRRTSLKIATHLKNRRRMVAISPRNTNAALRHQQESRMLSTIGRRPVFIFTTAEASQCTEA
jgi:hypothetical protein